MGFGLVLLWVSLTRSILRSYINTPTHLLSHITMLTHIRPHITTPTYVRRFVDAHTACVTQVAKLTCDTQSVGYLKELSLLYLSYRGNRGNKVRRCLADSSRGYVTLAIT